MTKAELYQKACMLPLLPGVYIIRDKTDTIIYIGKAKRLRIRVSCLYLRCISAAVWFPITWY